MLRTLRITFLSGFAGCALLLGKAGASTASENAAGWMERMADANGEFAIALYHELAAEHAGKNLFFSPYSVSIVLAMTAEGARGETAEQMGKVLRFPIEARRQDAGAATVPWRTGKIHAGLAALEGRLNADKDPAQTRAVEAKAARLRARIDALKRKRPKLPPGSWNYNEAYLASIRKEEKLVAELNEELGKVRQYELRTANSLWGEQHYPFKQEYFRTIARYYRTGGVFKADFKGRYEEERKRINLWVEDRTEKRIKNLLPEGALDDLTKLVLVNAIYFKGDWDMPFKENSTYKGGFDRADGRRMTTPIMHEKYLRAARYAAFNVDGTFFKTPEDVVCGSSAGTYPDSGGFAMAELPYKGGQLSMVVILPDHPAGLAALEKQLTRSKLAGWMDRLSTRAVDLHLPKMQLDTEYHLGGGSEPRALQRMGMVRAFRIPGRHGAEFEGMSHAISPNDKPSISLVVQKAFLEVNEKGTEAAAATAVVTMGNISGSSHCPFTPIFKADRPFLFLIRDRATGSILFLGRMMDPSRHSGD